jgi:hypothetical protein
MASPRHLKVPHPTALRENEASTPGSTTGAPATNGTARASDGVPLSLVASLGRAKHLRRGHVGSTTARPLSPPRCAILARGRKHIKGLTFCN